MKTKAKVKSFQNILFAFLYSAGIYSIVSASNGFAELKKCKVTAEDIDRLAKRQGEGTPHTPWAEKKQTINLKSLTVLENLVVHATSIEDKSGSPCNQWVSVQLPGRKVEYVWDRWGCPGEEGAEFGPTHFHVKGESEDHYFRAAGHPFGTTPEGIFCAGETIIVLNSSGPGEYGSTAAEIILWNIPSGEVKEVLSWYSGGKSCDDGESRFEPLDIVKNIGPIKGTQVSYVPANDVLILKGTSGTVAINLKSNTYWGIDLKSGDSRGILPGEKVCEDPLKATKN